MPDPNTEYEGDEFVATYLVEANSEADLETRIKLIADHFFPGTGSLLPGLEPARRAKFTGRILSMQPAIRAESGPLSGSSSTESLVRIAVPQIMESHEGLAMLFSTVAGEVLSLGGVRLLDLSLPPWFAAAFTGPKFGVTGIRELADVRARPLLVAITKPCRGYSPEEGATAFLEVALGGADIIKDDELLTDPSYCRRAQRIRLYTQAARQAFGETGERTLYAVNITDRPERLLSNAIESIELGADILMVNWIQVGWDAVRAMCADPQVTRPVLGHNAGAAALCGNPTGGVSWSLINGMLPRLLGLDLVIFLTDQGRFAAAKADCSQMVREMTGPNLHFRPVLPVAGGGVTSERVGSMCAEYGLDVAIAAGGAIFGHPAGPREGARAFRRAIARVM